MSSLNNCDKNFRVYFLSSHWWERLSTFLQCSISLSPLSLIPLGFHASTTYSVPGMPQTTCSGEAKVGDSVNCDKKCLCPYRFTCMQINCPYPLCESSKINVQSSRLGQSTEEPLLMDTPEVRTPLYYFAMSYICMLKFTPEIRTPLYTRHLIHQVPKVSTIEAF